MSLGGTPYFYMSLLEDLLRPEAPTDPGNELGLEGEDSVHYWEIVRVLLTREYVPANMDEVSQNQGQCIFL